MFVETIKKSYGTDVPVFADDIVKLFRDYSRAYVFRMIKKAEEDGGLVLFSRGVYFIPKKTFFGKSAISSEMVAERRYLQDQKSVYGILSGLSLLNRFGITTQVPNTLEIVTNRETTRKRNVVIGGREFILRKSRCEITRENYPVYMLFQLFNDMKEQDRTDDFSRSQISEFMKENGITLAAVFSMAKVFPSTTVKKIVESGVLSGII